MTKLYAYLLGGLAAALLVLGLFTWGQQGHQKARQALAEGKVIATQRDSALDALRLIKAQAERDAEVLRKRISVAEIQLAEQADQKKELRRALETNPDWARSRIPAGVLDVLRASGANPRQAAPASGAAAKPSRARPTGRQQR